MAINLKVLFRDDLEPGDETKALGKRHNLDKTIHTACVKDWWGRALGPQVDVACPGLGISLT